VNATEIEKRTKIITVGFWIIAGVSAAGIGIGGLMSIGQDLAGAGMVQGFGILGAAVIAIPASLVVVWAAWRPWKSLTRNYKILVLSVWLLVLAPAIIMIVWLIVALLAPAPQIY
jgi:hypothetical protein